MPRALEWTVIHTQLPGPEGRTLLDQMKADKFHKVAVSNIVPCTICAALQSHTMRYQILQCSSSSCKMIGGPTVKCPRRVKVLTCTARDIISISNRLEHFSQGADPPSGRLMDKDKTVARALANHFVKPVRIRNSIADSNNGFAPALSKIQNFVAYHRKTKMNNSDDMDELEKMIWAKAYTGQEDIATAFSFSIKKRTDGKLLVGEGTDSDEFFVGYTTKALLQRLNRSPESFIFHLDATFKLSQVDYTTFVCGISDKQRVFHLVALFVASQRKQMQYATMLASLKLIYRSVVSKDLMLRFVMGDADEAQFNAVQEHFGDEIVYLMCFWHMITKFYEHGKSLTPAKLALAAADVYDMHYAISESQYHARKTMAVRRWMADPNVSEFGGYFYRQWLSGSFSYWQCFRTPPAFATTNNPVETFNAKIKKNYTLRQRMKMGLLLDQLSRCCNHESLFGGEFQDQAAATAKIKRRAKELRRMELLVKTPALADDDLEDIMIDDAGTSYVLVQSRSTPRIYIKPRKKTVEIIEICAQMGLNNARMDRDEQPDAGWSVDVRRRCCPCKFFFKYAECVHLYFALYTCYGTDNPPRRPLFNRSQRKRKRGLADEIADAVAALPPSRGRPILNGPALSLV